MLPEGTDERILKAASIAAEIGIAKPVVLGKEEDVRKLASSLNVGFEDVEVLNPETSPIKLTSMSYGILL